MFFFLCQSNIAIGVEQATSEKVQLELGSGDHIAIVGNALADRMQHDGWLEAHLQTRRPQLNLVVRNLGFTGDELQLRLRSKGFGSPSHWLDKTKANVVFAFFGYNESFAGARGIAKFRADLEKFIIETRPPEGEIAELRQLVLFSPAAYEDLDDPLLPSAAEMNDRLLTYVNAMAQVAAKMDVLFVDLFRPSLAAMESAPTPLTINGVHFNPQGNLAISQIIDQAFFSGKQLLAETELSTIRKAVCEKNFYWFQRYRTTDGYSIFGGRKGTGGSRWTPDNEVVMRREMEVLDAMTANRDRKIWAIAQGEEFEIDDSNVPPLIPVATNKPGPLGDGSYPFLGGEEAIEKMTVPKGRVVNLFASEEQFPELQNPVQSAVDTQGRLWVAAWPSYPHWRPTDEMNDKLLILEDKDGDGRADSCKVFADGLHNPTGFEFYNGGVYVAQIPDIWFFKDTDGDDVADVRQRVLSGIDSADTHHSINSFVIGPGGGLYFQEGLFHRTQIESPHGPPARVLDAGVFRYDPRSQAILPYANYGFANPHGHVFTYWGDDIIHDGTSARPLYGPAISGRTIYPNKHRNAPFVYNKRTRPCPATAILSSSHFPESVRDNLLVCNVIGEQGVLQYQLEADGAGVKGTETEPFLMSTDPNFRPVDLEIGSDGAVYLLDWQNPLIGHLQHNLRDSNRDHRHGRIYRIRCEDQDLLTNPIIADQPLDQLLPLLESRDNGIRYRTKIELSHRETSDVIEACQAWIKSLDPKSGDYEHHLIEALWVHQHHHVVNETLLRQLLGSSDHQARAAAGHVLRAWRTQVQDGQELTDRLIQDEHPKVRLAGVLICSDIDSTSAAELALEVAKQSTGRYLDYALTEATRTLAPLWTRTLANGKPFCDGNPAAMKYLLRSSSPGNLISLLKNGELLRELAIQPNLRTSEYYASIQAIANHRGTKPLDELLPLLEEEADLSDRTLPRLAGLLKKFEADELRPYESQLVRLATKRRVRSVRQAALASIARIDESVERLWKISKNSTTNLIDLLSSVRQIPESKTRRLFYERIRPLIGNPAAANIKRATPKVLSEVEVAAIDAMAYIPGNETEKTDDLLSVLEQNRHRASIVRTLGTVPKESRRPTDAKRLIATTFDYLSTVNARERASGDAARELELALEFADLLPAELRSSAIAQLDGFSVRTLAISTVPHRMAYDQQKIVAQAGEPLQLIFENQDNMPHNFVLVSPGRLARVGQRAEAEATLPTTIARQYVPRSRFVLLASDLLQPESRQVLNFKAPDKPGVYPYVCTYPGHWRRMFGALIVVDDLDAYQGDPTAYVKANRIKTRDELLKFNRPLKNWKFDELHPALARLADQRNFDRGSALYQTASCASCHTVPDDKRRFAPNLTKLDAQRTPAHILRSVLEPSHTIDKKYQMAKVLLDTGKVIVGLIVEENDKELVLMIDPLVNCEPTFIAKDEIEDRYESELSLMPAGLLDRFTEEEILEIVAFIVARGDRQHAVYKQN